MRIGTFLSGLLLVWLSCHGPFAWSQERVVGVVLPLTGPLAEVGGGIRNAVLLANEDYGADSEVSFLFEDNQYDARNTVSAVQKLLTMSSLRGLIVFGANPSIAVADIVERAKVPMISISTNEDLVRGRKYILRHYLDAEVEGGLIAREIERMAYKRVAIVTSQNDGVLPVSAEARRLLGSKVCFDEEIAPGEREFGSTASRIKLSNPSVVMLCLMPPQAGILARRLREIGFQGDFGGCHPIEIDAEARSPLGALVEAWFVGTDERGAEKFFDKYQQRFGEKAPIVATNGYDIGALFIHALGTAAPNDYLHTVSDFSGALGRYGVSAGNSFSVAGSVKRIGPHGIGYR